MVMQGLIQTGISSCCTITMARSKHIANAKKASRDIFWSFAMTIALGPSS